MNYKIVLELDYHFDQHFHDLHFISLHPFLSSNAMYGATNRTLQELQRHLNPSRHACPPGLLFVQLPQLIGGTKGIQGAGGKGGVIGTHGTSHSAIHLGQKGGKILGK